MWQVVFLPPETQPQQGLHRAPAPQDCPILRQQRQCHLQFPATRSSPPGSTGSAAAGRKAVGGYSLDVPLPRLCRALQSHAPAASDGPKRQQDTHATTSSPAKQEASSTLHLAAIRQYPRAWLLNGIQLLFTVWFRDQKIPVSVLNDSCGLWN